ncbi:MAG: protein serine/threonine phosphatase 2C family protein [Elusimicrobia bacterium]|nr:protein serine/threonine phosphatase 2C family protein [Elusimicrobiota bacterium]
MEKKEIKKYPFWTRLTSCGMAVIFFYVQVAYGVIEPSSKLWEERRKAAEELKRGKHKGIPNSNQTGSNSEENQILLAKVPSPESDKGLVAQLPSLELNVLSQQVPQKLGSDILGLGSQRENLQSQDARLQSEIKWLETIPASFANLKELYLPSQWKPQDLMVIHIQDVHENYEAQKNIARIIQALKKPEIQSSLQSPSSNPQVQLVVGLEGAKGSFAFDSYRSLPEKEHVKKIAEYFLKESLISGAEYVGMTLDSKNSKESPILFWGVENERLYLEHVRAFKDSIPQEKEAKKIVLDLQNSLNLLKTKILNSDLKELDENMTLHHKGQIKLSQYLKVLTQDGIPSYSEMIRKFMSALNLEETLNYEQVEKERRALTNSLVERLPKAELKNLVSSGLSYRLGNISYGAFYQYLKDLCQAYGVVLAKYPEMDKYVRYVLIADKIKSEALFKEVESLEKSRVQSFIVTKEEKEIVECSKDLVLMEKMVGYRFSPEDWKEYLSRKNEIVDVSQRIKRLEKYSGKTGSFGKTGISMVNPEIVVDPLIAGKKKKQKSSQGQESGEKSVLVKALKPFEKFNEAAIKRDKALVENLLHKVREKRKLQVGNLALLVSGGFHTQGMTDLLRQKQIAYAVLTPRLGKVEGTGTDYLEIFRRDKTPLEKLFTGERITLKSEMGTASSSMKETLPIVGLINRSLINLYAMLTIFSAAKSVTNLTPEQKEEMAESLEMGLSKQFRTVDKVKIDENIQTAGDGRKVEGVAAGIEIFGKINDQRSDVYFWSELFEKNSRKKKISDSLDPEIQPEEMVLDDFVNRLYPSHPGLTNQVLNALSDTLKSAFDRARNTFSNIDTLLVGVRAPTPQIPAKGEVVQFAEERVTSQETISQEGKIVQFADKKVERINRLKAASILDAILRWPLDKLSELDDQSKNKIFENRIFRFLINIYKVFYAVVTGVVMPLVETHGLAYAVTVIFGGNVFLAAAVIALVFPIAHTDLWAFKGYEGGKFSWKEFAYRFTLRFIGGGVFTLLLALPNGFEISFAFHMFWNIASVIGELTGLWKILPFAVTSQLPRTILAPRGKIETERMVPPIPIKLPLSMGARSIKSADRTRNENNQDSYFAEKLSNGIQIAAVFDGMGGHLAGERASAAARNAIQSELRKITGQESEEELIKLLEQAMLLSVKAVRKELKKINGGTTATVAIILPQIDGSSRILIANAGDSRAYLRGVDGGFEPLTVDNVAPRTAQIIKQSELSKHPDRKNQEFLSSVQSYSDLDQKSEELFNDRHVVNNVLSSKSRYVPVIIVARAPKGSRLLLTSDGIHDNLTDMEIKDILDQMTDDTLAPQKIAEKLIASSQRRAEDGLSLRSKPDDMTAVVMDLEGLAAVSQEYAVLDSMRKEAAKKAGTEGAVKLSLQANTMSSSEIYSAPMLLTLSNEKNKRSAELRIYHYKDLPEDRQVLVQELYDQGTEYFIVDITRYNPREGFVGLKEGESLSLDKNSKILIAKLPALASFFDFKEDEVKAGKIGKITLRKVKGKDLIIIENLDELKNGLGFEMIVRQGERTISNFKLALRNFQVDLKYIYLAKVFNIERKFYPLLNILKDLRSSEVYKLHRSFAIPTIENLSLMLFSETLKNIYWVAHFSDPTGASNLIWLATTALLMSYHLVIPAIYLIFKFLWKFISGRIAFEDIEREFNRIFTEEYPREELSLFVLSQRLVFGGFFVTAPLIFFPLGDGPFQTSGPFFSLVMHMFLNNLFFVLHQRGLATEMVLKPLDALTPPPGKGSKTGSGKLKGRATEPYTPADLLQGLFYFVLYPAGYQYMQYRRNEALHVIKRVKRKIETIQQLHLETKELLGKEIAARFLSDYENRIGTLERYVQIELKRIIEEGETTESIDGEEIKKKATPKYVDTILKPIKDSLGSIEGHVDENLDYIQSLINLVDRDGELLEANLLSVQKKAMEYAMRMKWKMLVFAKPSIGDIVYGTTLSAVQRMIETKPEVLNSESILKGNYGWVGSKVEFKDWDLKDPKKDLSMENWATNVAMAGENPILMRMQLKDDLDYMQIYGFRVYEVEIFDPIDLVWVRLENFREEWSERNQRIKDEWEQFVMKDAPKLKVKAREPVVVKSKKFKKKQKKVAQKKPLESLRNFLMDRTRLQRPLAETLVFQWFGMAVLPVLLTTFFGVDPELAKNIGIAWATAGFTLFHFASKIVQWIVKAEKNGWTSKDAVNFAILLVVSAFFTAPFLVLDQVSSSLITIGLHSFYNSIILWARARVKELSSLRKPIPGWIKFISILPLAQIAAPQLPRGISILEVKKDHLKDATRDAEDLAKILFSDPTVETVDMLREVTGINFELSDLTENYQVNFLGSGSHKWMFMIELSLKDGRSVIFNLGLSNNDSPNAIGPQELEDLEILSTSGYVPRIGKIGEYNSRKYFVGQFIKGSTPKKLKEKGPLNLDKRKLIVQTLLTITFLLGNNMPKDIHAGNFILTGRNNQDSAVIIDLGERRQPIEVGLIRIISHYGYFGKDKGSNSFIFQAFADRLGENGVDVLKENLKLLNRVREDEKRTGKGLTLTPLDKEILRQERGEPALQPEDVDRVIQELEEFLAQFERSPAQTFTDQTVTPVSAQDRIIEAIEKAFLEAAKSEDAWPDFKNLKSVVEEFYLTKDKIPQEIDQIVYEMVKKFNESFKSWKETSKAAKEREIVALVKNEFMDVLRSLQQDPLMPQIKGRDSFLKLLQNTPIEKWDKIWYVMGDLDLIGTINKILGKSIVGSLNYSDSPDLEFAKRSLFREIRAVLAKEAKDLGFLLIYKGVGADEFNLVFVGEQELVEQRVSELVKRVNNHFLSVKNSSRNSYDVFEIKSADLTSEQKAKLEEMKGSLVLARYGSGYTLLVDRKITSKNQIEQELNTIIGKENYEAIKYDDETTGLFTISASAVSAKQVLDHMGELAPSLKNIYEKKKDVVISEEEFSSQWIVEEKPTPLFLNLMMWINNDFLSMAKENGRNRAVISLNLRKELENSKNPITLEVIEELEKQAPEKYSTPSQENFNYQISEGEFQHIYYFSVHQFFDEEAFEQLKKDGKIKEKSAVPHMRAFHWLQTIINYFGGNRAIKLFEDQVVALIGQAYKDKRGKSSEKLTDQGSGKEREEGSEKLVYTRFQPENIMVAANVDIRGPPLDQMAEAYEQGMKNIKDKDDKELSISPTYLVFDVPLVELENLKQTNPELYEKLQNQFRLVDMIKSIVDMMSAVSTNLDKLEEVVDFSIEGKFKILRFNHKKVDQLLKEYRSSQDSAKNSGKDEMKEKRKKMRKNMSAAATTEGTYDLVYNVLDFLSFLNKKLGLERLGLHFPDASKRSFAIDQWIQEKFARWWESPEFMWISLPWNQMGRERFLAKHENDTPEKLEVRRAGIKNIVEATQKAFIAGVIAGLIVALFFVIPFFSAQVVDLNVLLRFSWKVVGAIFVAGLVPSYITNVWQHGKFNLQNPFAPLTAGTAVFQERLNIVTRSPQMSGDQREGGRDVPLGIVQLVEEKEKAEETELVGRMAQDQAQLSSGWQAAVSQYMGGRSQESKVAGVKEAYSELDTVLDQLIEKYSSILMIGSMALAGIGLIVSFFNLWIGVPLLTLGSGIAVGVLLKSSDLKVEKDRLAKKEALRKGIEKKQKELQSLYRSNLAIAQILSNAEAIGYKFTDDFKLRLLRGARVVRNTIVDEKGSMIGSVIYQNGKLIPAFKAVRQLKGVSGNEWSKGEIIKALATNMMQKGWDKKYIVELLQSTINEKGEIINKEGVKIGTFQYKNGRFIPFIFDRYAPPLKTDSLIKKVLAARGHTTSNLALVTGSWGVWALLPQDYRFFGFRRLSIGGFLEDIFIILAGVVILINTGLMPVVPPTDFLSYSHVVLSLIINPLIIYGGLFLGHLLFGVVDPKTKKVVWDLEKIFAATQTARSPLVAIPIIHLILLFTSGPLSILAVLVTVFVSAVYHGNKNLGIEEQDELKGKARKKSPTKFVQGTDQQARQRNWEKSLKILDESFDKGDYLQRMPPEFRYLKAIEIKRIVTSIANIRILGLERAIAPNEVEDEDEVILNQILRIFWMIDLRNLSDHQTPEIALELLRKIAEDAVKIKKNLNLKDGLLLYFTKKISEDTLVLTALKARENPIESFNSYLKILNRDHPYLNSQWHRTYTYTGKDKEPERQALLQAISAIYQVDPLLKPEHVARILNFVDEHPRLLRDNPHKLCYEALRGIAITMRYLSSVEVGSHSFGSQEIMQNFLYRISGLVPSGLRDRTQEGWAQRETEDTYSNFLAMVKISQAAPSASLKDSIQSPRVQSLVLQADPKKILIAQALLDQARLELKLANDFIEHLNGYLDLNLNPFDLEENKEDILQELNQERIVELARTIARLRGAFNYDEMFILLTLVYAPSLKSLGVRKVFNTLEKVAQEKEAQGLGIMVNQRAKVDLAGIFERLIKEELAKENRALSQAGAAPLGTPSKAASKPVLGNAIDKFRELQASKKLAIIEGVDDQEMIGLIEILVELGNTDRFEADLLPVLELINSDLRFKEENLSPRQSFEVLREIAIKKRDLVRDGKLILEKKAARQTQELLVNKFSRWIGEWKNEREGEKEKIKQRPKQDRIRSITFEPAVKRAAFAQPKVKDPLETIARTLLNPKSRYSNSQIADLVKNEESLEAKVSSLKNILQPYIAPILSLKGDINTLLDVEKLNYAEEIVNIVNLVSIITLRSRGSKSVLEALSELKKIGEALQNAIRQGDQTFSVLRLKDFSIPNKNLKASLNLWRLYEAVIDKNYPSTSVLVQATQPKTYKAVENFFATFGVQVPKEWWVTSTFFSGFLESNQTLPAMLSRNALDQFIQTHNPTTEQRAWLETTLNFMKVSTLVGLGVGLSFSAHAFGFSGIEAIGKIILTTSSSAYLFHVASHSLRNVQQRFGDGMAIGITAILVGLFSAGSGYAITLTGSEILGSGLMAAGWPVVIVVSVILVLASILGPGRKPEAVPYGVSQADSLVPEIHAPLPLVDAFTLEGSGIDQGTLDSGEKQEIYKIVFISDAKTIADKFNKVWFTEQVGEGVDIRQLMNMLDALKGSNPLMLKLIGKTIEQNVNLKKLLVDPLVDLVLHLHLEDEIKKDEVARKDQYIEQLKSHISRAAALHALKGLMPEAADIELTNAFNSLMDSMERAKIFQHLSINSRTAQNHILIVEIAKAIHDFERQTQTKLPITVHTASDIFTTFLSRLNLDKRLFAVPAAAAEKIKTPTTGSLRRGLATGTLPETYLAGRKFFKDKFGWENAPNTVINIFFAGAYESLKSFRSFKLFQEHQEKLNLTPFQQIQLGVTFLFISAAMIGTAIGLPFGLDFLNSGGALKHMGGDLAASFLGIVTYALGLRLSYAPESQGKVFDLVKRLFPVLAFPMIFIGAIVHGLFNLLSLIINFVMDEVQLVIDFYKSETTLSKEYKKVEVKAKVSLPHLIQPLSQIEKEYDALLTNNQNPDKRRLFLRSLKVLALAAALGAASAQAMPQATTIDLYSLPTVLGHLTAQELAGQINSLEDYKKILDEAKNQEEKDSFEVEVIRLLMHGGEAEYLGLNLDGVNISFNDLYAAIEQTFSKYKISRKAALKIWNLGKKRAEINSTSKLLSMDEIEQLPNIPSDKNKIPGELFYGSGLSANGYVHLVNKITRIQLEEGKKKRAHFLLVETREELEVLNVHGISPALLAFKGVHIIVREEAEELNKIKGSAIDLDLLFKVIHKLDKEVGSLDIYTEKRVFKKGKRKELQIRILKIVSQTQVIEITSDLELFAKAKQLLSRQQ